MNSSGGAPPPPPPPFKFPGMVTPQPRPPPSVVSEPPPTMANIQKAGMPAALAGAMMKDKKPFTYTPGGLDLSEIKSPSMQRRLQRNASLEGVKPSPLAQQPSSTTQGASSLSPQGMIQVLPMPGVGMAPTKKPQAKEPPKPKRTVCGPAPLPPPFSCGVEARAAESTEAEKTVSSNSINNSVNNTESDNNVCHYPKSSSQLPVNTMPSEMPKEENLSDNITNNVANIPPPPPLPITNKTKVGNKKIKEKADDFVDLTELEDTINSFSNKLDKNIVMETENGIKHHPEENVTNENIADCISEITDCSSPIYPEEQNSIQNPSDQSQDIASSSDADNNQGDGMHENLPPNSSRWNPDKNNYENGLPNVTTENYNPTQAYYDNGVNNKTHLANEDDLLKNGDISKISSPKSISADIELKNEQLPVYADRSRELYCSNNVANNYTANNTNILPSPHTDDVNDRSGHFARQTSLPVNSMARTIHSSINNRPLEMSENHNQFEYQQNSQEKQSLDMDKPLPWMMGIKKEESLTPEFVQRADKAQQRFQRQKSLPQKNEPQHQSAPWRLPHHRSSDTSGRNRSISPKSMHLTYSDQSSDDHSSQMDEGHRSMANQSHYATLPSTHRTKGHQMQFQNSTIQQNAATTQSQHKERIIPIMLEASPPETPQGNFEAINYNSHNNIPTNYNSPNNPNLNSYFGQHYPGTNVSQFNPTFAPYSVNATEALHQIQHNLNRLNNGLKNEDPYSQNGPSAHQGVKVVLTNESPSTQSKSFNLIQKTYETPSSSDSNAEELRKYTGSNIPSRSFKVLQAMTDTPRCS